MLKDADTVFDEIVELRTGQGVMYAPKAIMEVVENVNDDDDDRDRGEFWGWSMRRLGTVHQVVKVRSRVTADGGSSMFAVNY